jgi:hypothetical protein
MKKRMRKRRRMSFRRFIKSKEIALQKSILTLKNYGTAC